MNNEQRQWSEPINSGSNNPRYSPQTDPNGVNMKPLMGYYKSLSTRVGPRGEFEVATIAVLGEDKSMIDVDVSGGKVLMDKLHDVPLNSYVYIKFIGKVPSKSGGSYNNWEVRVDQGAIPLDKLNTVASTPPVQTQVQQPSKPAPPAFNPAAPKAAVQTQQQQVQQPAATTPQKKFVPSATSTPTLDPNRDPGTMFGSNTEDSDLPF